jgi:aspartate/methionine/tyrosine aminotransferase
MPVAQRVKDITPFQVMEILERAHELERAGKRVIHLEIGEPDFETPECVNEAALRAIRDGKTHYTHSLGIIELREAICEYYGQRYRASVHPDQVIVTQGTSPAMFLAFAALLHPGDKVVHSDPCYACYPNFIEFAGGVRVPVRVFEDDGFQYRVERIREVLDDRVKAVLINSPANPTGTVLSAERTRAIAGLGPVVVSDEIYQGLVYEGEEHSILEYTDRAMVLNGFSKLFAMTGWRLGYLIAPREYIRPMQRLCQNFFISACSVSQWAGVAALKEAWPDVERMRATYGERRLYLLKRLEAMGFSVKSHPTGAFYVLAGAGHLKGSEDSLSLAFDILDQALVGVTPGIDFGPGAEGYLRFSYANSLENIAEGMDRLEAYVAEHSRK